MSPSTGGSFSGAGLNSRQPLFSRHGSMKNDTSFQMQRMEAGDSFDEDIEDLHSSVRRLKQVSYAIQEETSLTSTILSGLESSMDLARDTLKQTMARLDRVSRKTKSNHVLYVVLFGLLVFFVVFFWIKVRNMLRWIGVIG